MISIRRTLVWTLLAALAAVELAAAAATYVTARAEADQIFDYHLRQLALSLRDQAFHDALDPLTAKDEEGFDTVIQVWDKSGAHLYISHPRAGLPERAQLGFDNVSGPTGKWRVFSTVARDRVIQVAQPLQQRDQLAIAAALRTLLPQFLLLFPLGILTWLLIGHGLAPLERLARAVGARSADALDPLPAHGLPAEVRPLAEALNALLYRLGHSLAAQRAFIADAAHELRTPLTALQLQVQLAERADGDAQRSAALADLKRGIARTAHLVRQLLTLARQERDEGVSAPTALNPIVSLACADLAALAEARSITVAVETGEKTPEVAADAEALRTLITNLLDNALRYTPEGGSVCVRTWNEDGAARLEIGDSGPGIPAHERERVFDRFYRRESSGETGSGLGLAIVKTIAQRHGAFLTLGESRLAGLLVQIGFPQTNPRTPP